MKTKIIALMLVLTLLSGSAAYAVPLDLWDEDLRVESLYTSDVGEVSEFDVIQKIIDYIGIASKEDISGDGEVQAAVLLRSLAKIVGFEYADSADNKTILDDLKAAKFFREDAKASLISLQDVLYAATRITGWCEVKDIDAVILTEAKKAGLMRNIAFSTGRNLTKSETAQLLYNIISVPVKKPKSFEPGVVNLDKTTERPIIETKYGITLKKGIVTSVFGESVYNVNALDANEIEIDNVAYRFNESEIRSGLVGRSIVYFIDIENQFVIFAEPTTENIEHVINYGEKPQFKANTVEYENDTDEYILDVSGNAKVIYNGLSAGAYSPELMNRYFGEDTNITAVDNNEDGVYDYLFIKRWESFIVDTGAGPEGIFTFANGRTYNGLSSFDASPDDRMVHVKVLKNGEPVEPTVIADGSVVSISATLNETGHRYIIVEAGFETVSGVLNSSFDKYYVVDGVTYPVASEYLEAQETLFEVNTPVLGETYTFYIDITGRVVNADVANEYIYGFLVSMNQERGLDKPYIFKIFSQDGKMYEMPLAEKVTLYTPEKPAGVKYEANDFANLIYNSKDESGDYRRFIQYKLTRGELSDVWFALDNTSATVFGNAGYQFTLDIKNTYDVEYDGGLITPFTNNTTSTAGDGWACWGKTTILFAIPTDKNATDDKYQIKPPAYNGSRWIGDTDFYCVDDWNMIEAAILHMLPEAYIDNYSPLYIVDKVVAAKNNLGDPCYKVYGNNNGEMKSVFIGENVVSTAGAGGWLAGVTAKDLKFGDIIQVSQVDGMADSLRVVYRYEDGIDDFKRSEKGPEISGQLEVETGTYGGRRNSIYRMFKKLGDSTVSVMKGFSASNAVYIVDMSSKKITKSTFADLTIGDKLVIHSKWGTLVNNYIYR